MGIVRADRTRAFVQKAKLPSLQVARQVRAGGLEEAPPLELKNKDAQVLVVGSSLIAARLAAYRKSFIKEVKLAPLPSEKSSRTRNGKSSARRTRA